MTPTLTSEKNASKMNFLKKEFIGSNRVPKELLEDVLGNMSLKDIPFSFLQLITEDDINSLEEAIGDETFPNMDGKNDAKSLIVLDFFQKHPTSRTS